MFLNFNKAHSEKVVCADLLAAKLPACFSKTSRLKNEF